MAHTTYRKEGDLAKELRRRAGHYIKGLRLDAGLTQQELAKRCDYAYYTFVSQVELGVTRLPPEALPLWAKALGVPVDKFAKELLRFYDPYTYAALFVRGAKVDKDPQVGK